MKTEEYKRCPKCTISKPIHEFGSPARGYCKACLSVYSAELRATPVPITDDDTDRFWSKVDTSGDCWYWQAQLTDRGYGVFTFGHNSHRAHRVAYELTYGPLPKGLFVCHRCDTPACVRPDHLFLGTHEDNMRDMAKKKRSPRGEFNKQSVLTREQVQAIRDRFADGETKKGLARVYRVSDTLIRLIVNGKLWKDED